MRSLRLFPCLVACLFPVAGLAQTGSTPLTLRAAHRLMEQGTWGPQLGDYLALQTKTFDSWFAAQVAAPISTYADQPLTDPTTGDANTNIAPVQLQFFQNALSGPDQLRQRVAFALSEIWVASDLEINNASAIPPLLRIFQNRAFGNYEDLMTDVTLNPAMGQFLNMVNNAKGNPTKGTSANENYGREFMQLFTIGLTKLNVDGTPVVDTNGNPVPTYTPADVTNLANAFTGWTYGPMPGSVTKGNNPTYYLVPMVPLENEHDMTAKTILGTNLAAGQTAEEDLANAIHIIFLQPSLPPFVCQQLIQHLVTSNPSSAYVARVTNVFVNNGSGVRGDLQAVVRAILIDPEARQADDPSATLQPTFGHLREPVLFLANILRGLGGTVTASAPVVNAGTSMSQQLFYEPSVFSYFSPQSRTPTGLLGPEFQIYSTQTSSNRADTVNSVIYGATLGTGTSVNLAPYIAAASNPSTLITLINSVFFHGAMSSNVSNAMTQAMAAVTAASDKAKAALYIALTAQEYQVIH